MKRTVVIATGIVTLAAGIYLGSRVFAQTGSEAPPPKHPETRIAAINLALVVKNYHKATAYEKEFKDELERYQGIVTAKKGEMTSKDQALKAVTTPPAQKEQLEADITRLGRELQDLEKAEGKRLRDKQQNQIVILYNDVQQYVALLAKSKGFDFVITFNDSPNPAEINNPVNVVRKITVEGCMPLYMAQGINISDEVIYGLNYNYDPKPGTGAPAGR